MLPQPRRRLREGVTTTDTQLDGNTVDWEAAAVQAERVRIAQTLHNGIAQNLALLVLKLEIIGRLADRDPTRMKAELQAAMEILQASTLDLRDAVYALRIPDVERLGIVRATRQLAQSFSQQANAAVNLDLPEICVAAPEIQSTVFRVIQKRLEAIDRQGSACQVWLALREQGDHLTVTVRDDGTNPTTSSSTSRKATAPAWDIGLREQIALLRGELRVLRSRGETTVEIVVPLPS
jgi:two-component system sensor histidine kinase DesK